MASLLPSLKPTTKRVLFSKSEQSSIKGKEGNNRKVVTDTTTIDTLAQINVFKLPIIVETNEFTKIEPIEPITQSNSIKHIVLTNAENAPVAELKRSSSPKLRVVSKHWEFSLEDLNQKDLIRSLLNIVNTRETSKSSGISLQIIKTAMHEIKRKISSYKSQDKTKALYDETNFVQYEDVLRKMNETELMCYYCGKEMDLLYNVSREMSQWTIDRIDNNKGHNNDNYYLACLQCNLKRRCRDDDKFLFGTNLKIEKIKI